MIRLHRGRKGLDGNGADWRVFIVSAPHPGGEARPGVMTEALGLLL